MTGTFKFNKLILNDTAFRKIMNASKSPEAAALLTRYGNYILTEARPKLSKDYDKRYTTKTPLSESYIVTEPKLKNVKYQGFKFQSYCVYVKPKKNYVYYYVASSGSNTYQGKKKKLHYQNSAAIPFPVETATKKRRGALQKEFIQLVRVTAGKTND